MSKHVFSWHGNPIIVSEISHPKVVTDDVEVRRDIHILTILCDNEEIELQVSCIGYSRLIELFSQPVHYGPITSRVAVD